MTRIRNGLAIGIQIYGRILDGFIKDGDKKNVRDIYENKKAGDIQAGFISHQKSKYVRRI